MNPLTSQLPPEQFTIPRLHSEYNRLTRLDIRLRVDIERLWWDLHRDYNGDTERLLADMRFLIPWLKSQINDGKRNPGALRPRNLLQPDQWEDDLAQAKIATGKRPPRPAQITLIQTVGDTTREIQAPAPNADADAIGKYVAEGLREFIKANKK